jgi:hypothetical protein
MEEEISRLHFLEFGRRRRRCLRLEFGRRRRRLEEVPDPAREIRVVGEAVGLAALQQMVKVHRPAYDVGAPCCHSSPPLPVTTGILHYILSKVL